MTPVVDFYHRIVAGLTVFFKNRHRCQLIVFPEKNKHSIDKAAAEAFLPVIAG